MSHNADSAGGFDAKTALDSFVTKIKDVGQTVAEGASKVGTLAVDSAKNVGASAAALGVKAADGAKSVGASAVSLGSKGLASAGAKLKHSTAARELLSSPHLYVPRFKYTPCVKTGPFYTIGIIGLDPATRVLVSGGPYAEAKQILLLLCAALPDWGLSLEHLVQARIYTTQMDKFTGDNSINQAWDEVFADVAPPARTSIGVKELPLGSTVEMEFTMYKAD